MSLTRASVGGLFACDGFPIVVERDAPGDLPTDAGLDVCHGRTSWIELDGDQVQTTTTPSRSSSRT